MSFASLANRLSKTVTDNSPVILTAIGAVGTLSTAYLAGRAGYKAAKVVEEAEGMRRVQDSNFMPLDTRQIIEKTWKLYMPAAGVAAVTCASIVYANRIGTQRAAAIAAAYTISQQAAYEFKDKVAEKLTAPKLREIKREIAQEKVDQVFSGDQELTFDGKGDVLMLDAYSMRPFWCDVETIRRAENNIRDLIHRQDSATISDYYNEIGLRPTAVSDKFGWNHDAKFGLDDPEATIVEEGPYKGKPCLVWHFINEAVLRPDRFHH